MILPLCSFCALTIIPPLRQKPLLCTIFVTFNYLFWHHVPLCHFAPYNSPSIDRHLPILHLIFAPIISPFWPHVTFDTILFHQTILPPPADIGPFYNFNTFTPLQFPFWPHVTFEPESFSTRQFSHPAPSNICPFYIRYLPLFYYPFGPM